MPPVVAALAQRLEEVGGRAFLVGGGVRDHLMGRAIHDWDVEVFGVDVETLRRELQRLGKVSLVGRSFGVFKLRPRGWDGDEIDVSVPRRDSKVGPGHRGIAVEGDPSMSIEEASRRRDLTVNALMYDLVEERVVDPQGGLDDLRDGRLRAVDADTFLEDPLRALRAVQFTARLGFQVDPGLVSLCRAASLDELPAERILGEWTKLMLHGVAVSQGLQVARDAQILSRVFPMVSDAPDPVADAALDRLEARIAALTARGVDVSNLDFEASYGRTSMEYYDGFVFGFYAESRPDLPPVASGGR